VVKYRAMSRAEPILDYASPRKRSALRMSSKSLLDCRYVEDGVVVRESLGEQSQAVVVIAGSALTVLVLLGTMSGEWHRTPPILRVLPALVVTAWAIVVPVVIQRNWSRTELSVRDGGVRLYMGGPLASRRFNWTFEQISAVRVIAIPIDGVDFALGEIEILAEGAPPIRLFTDHTEYRLAQVGQAIDFALKGQRPHPIPREPRADLSRFHFGPRPDA